MRGRRKVTICCEDNTNQQRSPEQSGAKHPKWVIQIQRTIFPIPSIDIMNEKNYLCRQIHTIHVMKQTVTQSTIVTEENTAFTMGSGTLPVYATPALVAFMENTACQLLDNIEEGYTTVGTRMDIKHLRASAIGERIECTAKLTEQDGRKYTFSIEAYNEQRVCVATAVHERFCVNIEHFMQKLR